MSTTLTFAVLTLAVGWLIGGLPLGSLAIRWLTGKEPSAYSAHNLGVENVLRFLGPTAALTALLLDIVKGFAAAGLTSGSAWGVLGAFAGHLHPPIANWRERTPRGRGNGVLLGALAGLVVFGEMPFLAGFLPVAVFAALLAATSYVALATLLALLSLPLLAVLLGLDMQLSLASTGLLLVALWRHKSSITRILDRTEVRFGDPPPVRGIDPGVVRAAFMVHPMRLGDLWQTRSQGWIGSLVARGVINERLLLRILPYTRPQLYGEVTGIRLSDGRELRVLLIGGAMVPEQIRANPELATRLAIQGARFARDLGAEAFGLGAFWSTVGNKGVEVQKAVPDLAITNGGAYTAATVRAAVPGLLKRFQREGGSLRASTAAVVGANGVVAFGVARLIAPEVGHLVLVGRDAERLERSAVGLRKKFPNTRIESTTEMAAIAAADLVFTATSDPHPVVYKEHVKPGAWVYDLGRPADVDEGVREVPGVHVIPGGVVRPPGDMKTRIDIQFGDGLVPACMAETMIMTATRAFDRASLGPLTRSVDIEFYLREGERLGFEVITRDERVIEPAVSS
ncbi:MAG: glycerol-3-phosphate acyltransferase [Trueperaceae bacterium]